MIPSIASVGGQEKGDRRRHAARGPGRGAARSEQRCAGTRAPADAGARGARYHAAMFEPGIDFRSAVEGADARIRPHVLETPLEPSPELSGRGGAEVFLKMENLQRTGSFKLRGAVNKLLAIGADERARGIVTASSGNHGAAISWALEALGGRGVVYVPENASPAKLAAIRDHGAEVRPFGTDSGLCEIEARRHARESGLTYVSPYNDLDIVAGQGTVGLEIARQLDGAPRGGPDAVPGPDAVLVALGGGGLIAGIGG